MSIYQAIVIEDEPSSRVLLKTMISEYCPEIVVISEAESVEDATDEIRKHNPDVIFMDVDLFGVSGFNILDEVRLKRETQLIFTTAHGEHALNAFNYDATDFLLKPIGPRDLKRSVAKAVERLRLIKGAQVQVDASVSNAGVNKIALPSLSGYSLINLEDVLYIKADGNYSEFHLKTDGNLLICKSIRDLEDQLTKKGFFRVHKSYLINLGHMIKYEKGRGGQVIMNNRELIPVAARRKVEFLDRIQR